MPFPLQAISKDCVRGPAGVRQVYMIDGAEVQDLLFNDFDRVETIVLKAGATLKKVEFLGDTATFIQTESRTQGWPQVRQRLTFEHDGIPNQVLRSIKRLAEHCNVHLLVETNQGQVFYMGVSYYADRGYAWDSGNSVVSSGSARVEAVGGQVRLTTVLEATVRQFAPEVDADLALLPIEEPPPPDPVVDNVAPIAIIFLPPDDAVGVSITPNVAIYFNEVVKAGSGFLRLYDWDTDTLVGQYSISDPAVVQFDAGTASLSLVTPPNLLYNTRYYILVDATAVTDLAGNPWPGITTKGDWDFTTGAQPDTTAPTLVALTPADDTTGVDVVGLTASIQLNEDVAPGVGNVCLYDHDTDALVACYDVHTGTIVGDTWSVDISADVVTNKHYYFLVPAGALTDLAGNPWAGLTTKGDWDFTTEDTTGPQPTAYFPANSSTDNSRNTAMYIDVGEVVVKGTGTIKLVQGVDFTGPTDEGGNDIIHHTWDVATSPDITLTSGGLRINFTNAPALNYSGFYYFVIPAGAFEDAMGNSFPDHHVTGTPSAIWFFSVANQLTLVFAPTDEGTASCVLNPLLNVGYGRAMGQRSGWVLVYDWDTDVLIWQGHLSALGDAFSITGSASAQHFGFERYEPWVSNANGDELKLYNLPAADGQKVYVIMEAGMIYDPIHEEDLPVPTAKGDWAFTWTNVGIAHGDGTPLTDQTPAPGTEFTITDDGTGKGYLDITFTLAHAMAVREYAGEFNALYVRLIDHDTGQEVARVSSGNRRHVFLRDDNTGDYGGTEWRVVFPQPVVDKAKKYNIVIDEGFFLQRCTYVFPGVPLGEWIITGPDYVPGGSSGFNTGFDSGF